MMTNSLKKIIADALNEIKSLIEERYELEQQLETTSQTLAHARAEIQTRVASEKDENGKKRYSNEAEREAAALLLEDEDEDIRAMKKEVAQLLTKRRYMDHMLEYQKLRIQAAIALIGVEEGDTGCSGSSSIAGSARGGESRSPQGSQEKWDLEKSKKWFLGQE